METYNVAEARANLNNLILKTIGSCVPIQITSKYGSAVLIGADDWRAIEETMRRSSIPGMVESIHQAALESLEDGAVFDPGDEW